MVHTILLYGCETWPVREADERILAVFANDSIRRILHVRRRDCMSSVELWGGLCLTSRLALLVQRRLCWFGHAARRPEGELIKELILPTPPPTWRRRTGGKLKTPETTIKADPLPTATQDGERTGWKCLASSHRTVEPRMPQYAMWSTQLVMPVQPAPG